MWYLFGIHQRVLHESTYPGTLALRLAALAYVGTLDHDVYEVAQLTVRPSDEDLRRMLDDEFMANSGSDEVDSTISAFISEGLFVPVPEADLAARGFDHGNLSGQLLRLNREHLASLASDFGFVRSRAANLLQSVRAPAAAVPKDNRDGTL